ncbi:InlB B-repeat-containing protein [Paenibacillus donghaensis]|nr:InlB B-repeat-containing protein [Paenibacillus donghaensis]
MAWGNMIGFNHIEIGDPVTETGSGVITFSNNGNNGGSIITDGQGGSTDLAGVHVLISPIDIDGNTPAGFFMNYHDEQDWDVPPIVTPDDLNNGTIYGISIKSSPVVKFSMSSLNFYDWGNWDGGTYSIQAYTDGLAVGSPVSFIGNMDLNYVNIDLSLNTSFYNIDEVRIYRAGDNWFGINNIAIGSPKGASTYTLSYAAGSNGTLTGNAAQTVNSGDSGTAVTAVADAGYHFVKWSDDVTTATRTDANVLANVDVTASFAVNTYKLNYAAGNNGSLTGNAAQTVNSGANGTAVTAVADAGYHFVKWSDDVTTATRTDANVLANVDVTASFAVNTYKLNYTAGNNGTLTGSVAQTVNSGANGTAVTAVPDAGYHFVKWSDDVLTATRTDINVLADVDVTASFAVNTYKLNYAAGSNGTLTGIAAQTVNSGASGTAVTAVADAGYHFVKWSDDVTTATRTDANVLANVDVTASFAVNTYKLSYAAGNNGSLTGNAAQTVNSGASGTAVTAVADAGYHFVKWSDDVSTATRTDANVLANVDVTASFAVNTYKLNYAAGSNGTLTGIATQTVNNGANGTAVTAVPDAGYHFVKWSDDVSTATRTDANVLANVDVTASFAVNTYKLNYAAGSNGTLTGSATQTVNSGASGTAVTAVADAGYHFVKWSDDVLTATRTDINVLANVDVTASFAVNTYKLNYAAGNNGSLTGNAAQTVNSGANGTAVTAVADAGYHFVKWSDDDTTATRMDANVLANVDVTASFAANTYTISFNSNGGLPVDSQNVTYSAFATEPKAPIKAGYTFAGWYVDSNLTTKFNFTTTAITSDVTLFAKWLINPPEAPVIQSATSGNSSVVVQWTNVPNATEYLIYQSTAAGSYGNPLTTVSGTLNNYEILNLKNGTPYYFVVKATNDGGDSILSNELSATPMTLATPPTNIIATAGNTQAIISFTGSADDGGSTVTAYEVSEASGKIMATGTTSPITITGLSNGTAYSFTVKAINNVGSSISSAISNTVTPTSPSSGGGSIQPVPSSIPTVIPETTGTATTAVEVLVNGKVENAGTATTTQVNSQSVTTIAVDQEKLDDRLALEGQGAVITIPVHSNSDVIIGELNGQMIKNLEQNQAVLELKTERATYTLPSLLINIDSISKQLGESIALQDIEIQILISKPTSGMLKIVENSAVASGYSIVIPPIDFSVQAIYGNTTIELSKFKAYVERTIEIPEGIDPDRITTGIVVESDGTVRHVPTKIVVIDRKYFAKVSSLTNSSYTIVWHPLEFKDVAQHWAKDAVNDMGSRMVINGIGDEQFNPDQDITRAEFAAIMVRGLGLKLENNLTTFTDVKVEEWYSSAIQTLYSYNLINGFEEGTFRPMDKITREQAMVIIAKAMTITDLKAKLAALDTVDILHPYTDAANVSSWASGSIADVLEAGIVSGRSNAELAPKAYITRAEVAAIVQRLLQKSGLI